MAHMRLRGWVPVLGWCAATLASIGLATVALQPVLRTATPDLASAPLDRAAAAPPAATSAPPPSTPSPPVSPSPSASPSASRPSSPPTGASPTPSASPSPATVVDGWTVTDGPTYTRTFRVDGGTAVIRMTPGRVQLVTATPNPGYSVDTVQNEPGNLAVQFTEPNHYFVIHAVWQGKPVAQVSEVGS